MKWKANPYTRKDGSTTFFMRKLFSFRGWTVRLHKFTSPDDPGCFHSHPAVAYRLILWGGYVEERLDGEIHKWRMWKPGQFGRVDPDLVHRIAHLPGKVSISLWIRGPITHKVQYGCVD
jgi:hypothetical protein